MTQVNYLKDLLMLSCINPASGWMSRRNEVKYALMGAALIDLVLAGKLTITEGIVTDCGDANDEQDPVLAMLLKKLEKAKGEKITRIFNAFSAGNGPHYRLQMDYMHKSRLVQCEPVTVFGFRIIARYRIRAHGAVKQIQNQLYQVLIYGRKPNLKTSLLIDLLQVLRLIGTFFPDDELKYRARKSASNLEKSAPSELNDELLIILKSLRRMIRAARAS